MRYHWRMAAGGMYGDRAELYDLIYAWKDYAAEVAALRQLLASEGVQHGSRVLDVACGTGGHLEHLAETFQVAGLDASEAMLAIARRKVPRAELMHADMVDFGCEEPFDAVLCLFSAIGYLLDERQLRAAAGRFAAALEPGGVLVVEPWVAPEDFRAGAVHLHTYESDDLKLARASHSHLQRDVSVLDFDWLVARAQRGTEHFSETHRCWLCPRERMAAVFREAGFEVRFETAGLTDGRGVFVGRLKG
jgi:ubiquinone/menaquinone biosynthesis C-methylase UbiE